MSDCCCGSPVPDLVVGRTKRRPEWVTGEIDTPAGRVPKVAVEWGRSEARGARLCRLSNRFRMSYSIAPGLYAVGEAGPEDPVLVTANYKLSFDLLRRELWGRRAWILVLDTKGINVWCAAGKGSFGTGELLKRIAVTGLAEVVSHRRLLLPQLAAPGVRAPLVKERSGFVVSYGPAAARDLPAYWDAGGRCTEDMRRPSFVAADRLALVPMELLPALKKLPWVLLGVFLLFGLEPSGILFAEAWRTGWAFALLAPLAVFAGAVLTPVALPAIPFRSFALKGCLMGVLVTGAFLLLTGGSGRYGVAQWVMAMSFFPAASSFLALSFTGSTTFTGLSGVRRELGVAVPLYVASLVLTLTAAVLYKLAAWNIVPWGFLV